MHAFSFFSFTLCFLVSYSPNDILALPYSERRRPAGNNAKYWSFLKLHKISGEKDLFKRDWDERMHIFHKNRKEIQSGRLNVTLSSVTPFQRVYQQHTGSFNFNRFDTSNFHCWFRLMYFFLLLLLLVLWFHQWHVMTKSIIRKRRAVIWACWLKRHYKCLKSMEVKTHLSTLNIWFRHMNRVYSTEFTFMDFFVNYIKLFLWKELIDKLAYRLLFPTPAPSLRIIK